MEKYKVFTVSEDEAEIVATLFNQGVRDLNAISKILKWNDKKRKQFLDFCFRMDFVDMDDVLFDRPIKCSPSIHSKKLERFFANLPIKQKTEEYTIILGFNKRAISITHQDYEYISKYDNYNFENTLLINFVPSSGEGTDDSYIEIYDIQNKSDLEYYLKTPLAVIFFTQESAEGRKCYQISQVNIKPANNDELFREPDYYYSHLVSIFSLLDELVHTRPKTNSEIHKTKFYINDLQKKTYDIVIGLQQPVPIFQYLMQNKIDFGIEVQ